MKLLSFVFVLLSAHALLCSGVGIKRRLADNAACSAASGGGACPPDKPLLVDGPRKGLRQRMAASSSADEPRDQHHGPLHRSTRRDWAKGKLSSARVQDYVQGAAQQGASGMDGMASIGGSGSHPQNVCRALKEHLGVPEGAPDFHWAEIPTKHCKKTMHPLQCLMSFSSSITLRAEIC